MNKRVLRSLGRAPTVAVIACWGLGTMEAQTPAAPIINEIVMVPRLTIQSKVGVTNAILRADVLGGGYVCAANWQVLANVVVTQSPYIFVDLEAPPAPRRFYRVLLFAGTATPINPNPGSLVWIPPGALTIGSPDDETGRDDDEGPQTEVTFTRGFWISKHEVTQREYVALMGNNPSRFGGSLELPVEMVTWHDATDYCASLTEQERQAGRLPSGYEYRLPTEAEWEYACRAGTTTRFHYGEDPGGQQLSSYAWHQASSGGTTHRPGMKLPNAWCLQDMHGNVWEWCWDWHAPSLPGRAVIDPTGPVSGSHRVGRGGAWSSSPADCRSASREAFDPAGRSQNLGFRVALAPALSIPPNPNSDLLFWIPPGGFIMGSPADEQGRYGDEGPLTMVTFASGFWMGSHEVTQGEYLDVMGANPSWFGGDLELPVEMITWFEAVEFCARFTERERQAGRLPAGHLYRLPTEAEWEYACRAGTGTRFDYGDDPDYLQLEDHAWFFGNSFESTRRAGQKLPNAWGLHDMHGNVWEWCLDWYGPALPGGAIIDPMGPGAGFERVVRGGSWKNGGRLCRAAVRAQLDPAGQDYTVGFRVVLAQSR